MPKMVEIDEQDLLAKDGVINQVQAILNNPEGRKLLLHAQKKVNPKLQIPEIDQQDAIAAALEAQAKQFNERFDKLDKQRNEDNERAVTERVTKKWNDGQAFVRGQGYTDDGLKAVEDFMQKNTIADHEIALAAFEKFHPEATPIASPGPTAFDFFNPPANDDGSFMKSMLETQGNDERALNTEISKTLAELRGQR